MCFGKRAYEACRRKIGIWSAAYLKNFAAPLQFFHIWCIRIRKSASAQTSGHPMKPLKQGGC
jgi:hypothetical protein